MKSQHIKVIKDIFLAHKVCTISTLAEQLNCSDVTARRRLTHLEYYSSYTHNSRYYTIKPVAKFDNHGIWCYHDICFSQFRSLHKTMIKLIDESAFGLSVSDLSAILKIKCYSHLSIFYKAGHLRRIQTEKGYIYLSKQDDIYQKQISYYSQEKDLEPHIAIQLLIAYINNFDLTYKQLAQKLATTGFKVTVEQIKQFFNRHNLKKTPPS